MKALVFSGGGSKIAFEAGVAVELLGASGQPYDVVCGVSTGALAASMIAQAGTGLWQHALALRLRDVVLGLRGNGDIFKSGPIPYLSDALRLVRTGGLYDPAPLRRIVEKVIDLEALRRSNTVLRIGMVNLNSGAYLTCGTERGMPAEPKMLLPVTHDFIMASCAVPGVFPPVRLFRSGALLVDGGVRNITPLSDCFEALRELGAHALGKPVQVDVVMASPLSYNAEPLGGVGPEKVLPRALSILSNEVYRSDLAEALRRNSQDPKAVPCELRVFAPDSVEQDTLEFDPKKMRDLYNAGLEAARRPLTEAELYERLR